MKNYYNIIMILGIILLSGCTKINTSEIPYCKDLNVTGTNCHSPENLNLYGDDEDYNYSEAICKEVVMVGFDEKLTFCFDTLENMLNRTDIDYIDKPNTFIDSDCIDYCKEYCGIEGNKE